MNLHSTLPWGVAVTYSVAFVYQAKQPGLLGLENDGESRGSHGRLVHHSQQPAKWPGKKHSTARKGLLRLELLVQMVAQALFPSILQARTFVNLLYFNQVFSILAINNDCTLMFFPLVEGAPGWSRTLEEK